MRHLITFIFSFIFIINLPCQVDTTKNKATIQLSKEIAFEKDLLDSASDESINDSSITFCFEYA